MCASQFRKERKVSSECFGGYATLSSGKGDYATLPSGGGGDVTLSSEKPNQLGILPRRAAPRLHFDRLID